MKKFTSKTQKIGEIGESIACKYLLKRDFSILDRNYTRKWGEIDIIACRDGILHFIEVKSVSRENKDLFRPEDQVHSFKQKKLARTIELYINEKSVGGWQFDVMCVYLDMTKRIGRVKILENVVL